MINNEIECNKLKVFFSFTVTHLDNYGVTERMFLFD